MLQRVTSYIVVSLLTVSLSACSRKPVQGVQLADAAPKPPPLDVESSDIQVQGKGAQPAAGEVLTITCRFKLRSSEKNEPGAFAVIRFTAPHRSGKSAIHNSASGQIKKVGDGEYEVSAEIRAPLKAGDYTVDVQNVSTTLARTSIRVHEATDANKAKRQ